MAKTLKKCCLDLLNTLSDTANSPRGDFLLVKDGGGGSDILWVCETLSSIPLGSYLLHNRYIAGVTDEKI